MHFENALIKDWVLVFLKKNKFLTHCFSVLYKLFDRKKSSRIIQLNNSGAFKNFYKIAKLFVRGFLLFNLLCIKAR